MSFHVYFEKMNNFIVFMQFVIRNIMKRIYNKAFLSISMIVYENILSLKCSEMPDGILESHAYKNCHNTFSSYLPMQMLSIG